METGLKNVKIVANLPYYITTPIIMKLLEEKLEIKSITVMVQKEVADRLTETPGGRKSGAITYTVQYYALAEEIRTVPNDSFIPAPEVASEVIKLTFIKIAFMQRRKTLVNAVSNAGVNISKEKVEKVLQELGIDTKIRAEALTIEQFASIVEKT